MGDFPLEPELRIFFDQLNDAELFNSAGVAREYMAEYVSMKLDNWDIGYRIWRVFRVL